MMLDHSRYDCPLPCEKVIADGRNGRTEASSCGHVDTVLCSSDISTHKCRKVFRSSSVDIQDVHCYKKMSDGSDAICDELKPTLGPCGHNIDIYPVAQNSPRT
ncbi:hypothetical protein NPIL_381371 [Nephila pilipes]|uniref:Uncharacterized protein n=1 Tax=Nephila pilipes TaxID=299642 RepID=A0A8X6TDH2_NEPPI|nr:hypothetical protein NPIL_381371 [Nephila pilipes]